MHGRAARKTDCGFREMPAVSFEGDNRFETKGDLPMEQRLHANPSCHAGFLAIGMILAMLFLTTC
jgi:hypothetical protein